MVNKSQNVFPCCNFPATFIKIGQELLLLGGGYKNSFTERPCNMRKCVKLCTKKNGGYFESEL